MNFAPLLDVVAPIPLHAFTAMAALFLGIIQLIAPKGTLPHRALGWVRIALMLIISVSSLWIHGDGWRLWRNWSPIHILSVFVPLMLLLGAAYAHTHNVRGHQITMISIFAGALVIAGIFTLLPGRIMHKVVFGH
ncbi:putative membrane protein [Nitrobacteraceae bacterium AZCC 1564]